ncbi:hypothetical protein [Meiothermus taiwanensis]|jgi:hypothetical protein|uniref:Uncharacterized protein n=2 Tax=Meiothermus taiwanensis TaxID=172827 RepID=A0A399DY21_9DEIN|nr:hypothetical protein [Meiothermus taiwanensis]KIQ54222.1 hypothetical protein SY28_09760 [Meiothermus taiwanensis]KZK15812.1 hypothetical protein A3962_08870 [Meiothermus taiwanensis]RIH77174.1 hypothetical protein Mcate_01427 [Meiothermus taiwanensis]
MAKIKTGGFFDLLMKDPGHFSLYLYLTYHLTRVDWDELAVERHGGEWTVSSGLLGKTWRAPAYPSGASVLIKEEESEKREPMGINLSFGGGGPRAVRIEGGFIETPDSWFVFERQDQRPRLVGAVISDLNLELGGPIIFIEIFYPEVLEEWKNSPERKNFMQKFSRHQHVESDLEEELGRFVTVNAKAMGYNLMHMLEFFNQKYRSLEGGQAGG